MNNGAFGFRNDLFVGRTVIVCGASRGIGLGLAEGFAALGASVVATGRSQSVSGTPHANIDYRALDVRRRDDVGVFFAEFDSLDVLVNCAGIARPHDEFNPDVFLDVMDVNLNSYMWTANAARAALTRAQGNIINIASMLSFLADPDVPAYCASKTGVLGLTRSLAFAFGKDGVRVNAIAPGYHKTDMTRVHWEQPDVEHKIASRSALGRWGAIDDLVGPALFLASPGAAFITSSVLAVDGGFSVG